jgi:FdhD protein
MGRLTARVPARQVVVSDGPAAGGPTDGAGALRVGSRPDTLTVEEPLEIRVDRQPLAVTMRTPGDDFDLTIGFLVTEGLITGASDVLNLTHCQDQGPDGRPTYNVVDVALRPGVAAPQADQGRRFAITSACGVCGKSSIEAIRVRSRYDLSTDLTPITAHTLAGLPAALRQRQQVFDRTGGLHAAGLFTADGGLLAVREDVGRHNAVDKLIGWASREGRLPLTGTVLMVSGRASFELTQKAVVAGIPCLAAISAPSSLAVEMATESAMTLVGFLRPPRMTVYTGYHRLGLTD